MATVVKTVRIDIGISGDAASKQKLDSITARAEELKTAFPEYKLKIDSSAAAQKLAVFRADMKATAVEAARPMDIQVITKKAQAALDEIDAKALKLKATWPSYTVTIDDKAAKAKMDLLAAESKLVGDRIDKNLSGSGGGGFLSGLFGGGSGGAAEGAASGAASSGGLLTGGLTSPVGLIAITTAALAAIPVLASVATVATGAGAGIAAFGAIAMPTFTALTTALTGVHAANQSFAQSAAIVDAASVKGSADNKLYQASFKGLNSTQVSTVKLLGDSGVTWQGLSKSQQGNVIQLSQNSKALSGLLPAQKQSLTALLASRKAWDDLSPSQQAAAKSVQAVSGAWGKLTTAMAPSVLSVISVAAGQISNMIGPIGAIAKAAVPGIKDMIGILGNGLTGFLEEIKPLIAPSIGALNNLLIKMSPALQGLVDQMVKGMPQFVKLFGALATLVTVGIEFTSWLVMLSAKIIPVVQANFHKLAGEVDLTRGVIIHIGHDSEAVFNTIKDTVVKAFKTASDTFLGFVSTMLHGLLTITTTMGHLPGPLGAPWRAMSTDLRTAIGWVGGLKKSVDGLPTHKGVAINVSGSGSGTITFAQQIAGQNAKGFLQFHSAGARIPGYGGGDTYPAMLEGGESVVPKHLTPAVAPFLRAHGVPGFAAGGLVGPHQPQVTAVPWMSARMDSAGYASAEGFGRGILADMRKLVAAATAAATAAFTSGAPAHGSALAAQNFARSLLPSYGWANQWPALLNLWNRESGWNANAVNPASGAYGIPQSLGHGHPYNLGDYANQVRWGLAYIKGRYGGPNQAWYHELSSGWYDQGGYLPTGASIAINNTGRPERVGGGGDTYYITVNMPFGSTKADVENGLVKALDSLNNQRRLPK